MFESNASKICAKGSLGRVKLALTIRGSPRLRLGISFLAWFGSSAVVGCQQVPKGGHAKNSPCPFMSANPGSGEVRPAAFITSVMAAVR